MDVRHGYERNAQRNYGNYTMMLRAVLKKSWKTAAALSPAYHLRKMKIICRAVLKKQGELIRDALLGTYA